MKTSLKFLLIFLVGVLALIYYFVPFKLISASNTFLTISTFLFAIFTGFFIARQSERYSLIRDKISEFDGEMSSIYRSFGHFSKEIQEKAKKIILEHYKKIADNKSWDYHFTHKSTTITSLHILCNSSFKKQKLMSLEHLSLDKILVSLGHLQSIRKNMITLHNERIPPFQSFIVYFLAVLLLITVSVIPSHLNLLESILKGAFSASVIFVLILLKRFDELKFFEGVIGEHSAQDILDIFSGKR